MEVVRCSFCVMDNATDPTISFDRNGRCNYCLEAEKRWPVEYFPSDIGYQMLKGTIQTIKEDTKGQKYNCIVGVSGGLDSSYILYLGKQFGLKMLAIHIDDGFDTPLATENIRRLCEKADAELITVFPDRKEYADITLAFIKAGLPNICMPQDNILLKVLLECHKKYHIKYSLSGANFAMESILERSDGVTAADRRQLLAIHKQFGSTALKNTEFISMWENYIGKRYFAQIKSIKPLNMIDYNMKRSIKELEDFCGYEYYGSKHHENILTRFLQCFYLPVKFGKDIRKSHLSSLILSGQMTRDEALAILVQNPYGSEELFANDRKFLADYFEVSEQTFQEILAIPAKTHADYPSSFLNGLAPAARRLRRFLG